MIDPDSLLFEINVPDCQTAEFRNTQASIEKDIDGGLILSTEEYDIDLSFDAVLDMIFEQHESRFAESLFQTNEGSV